MEQKLPRSYNSTDWVLSVQVRQYLYPVELCTCTGWGCDQAIRRLHAFWIHITHTRTVFVCTLTEPRWQTWNRGSQRGVFTKGNYPSVASTSLWMHYQVMDSILIFVYKQKVVRTLKLLLNKSESFCRALIFERDCWDWWRRIKLDFWETNFQTCDKIKNVANIAEEEAQLRECGETQRVCARQRWKRRQEKGRTV